MARHRQFRHGHGQGWEWEWEKGKVRARNQRGPRPHPKAPLFTLACWSSITTKPLHKRLKLQTQHACTTPAVRGQRRNSPSPQASYVHVSGQDHERKEVRDIPPRLLLHCRVGYAGPVIPGEQREMRKRSARKVGKRLRVGVASNGVTVVVRKERLQANKASRRFIF
jgi:hypothetical protein